MNDSRFFVAPGGRVNGCLRVPGDKSISHRLALLGGLSVGTTVIDGFLTSEDCLHTLAAVAALGASVERDGTRVQIAGCADGLHTPDAVLDLGNSGTGMRLLVGLLAGQRVTATLTGDASLCRRPMKRIQEPLQQMGAVLQLTGSEGTAPLTVQGGGLHAIAYRLPMASAQVKSCILLAALGAEGETVVHEPRATRDHTERLLQAAGVPLQVDGLCCRLRGPVTRLSLAGRRWLVPGDFSSAAFWLAAAAAEGNAVTVQGVGLNPRRTALLDVLRRMGAEVTLRGETDEWEPQGELTVRGARLRGTVVGGDEIPNLIDELPLVAVLGALAQGETVIRDAAELRVKESDRIATMTQVLQAFGVQVRETPDGMIVTGGIHGQDCAQISSQGDHRIAMAAAVLALHSNAGAWIADTACVATSYPGFEADLALVRGGPPAVRSDCPQRPQGAVVAIDGPAASGKSTVARRVAQALGSLYVDSGALYRGVAWQVLRHGLAAEDFEDVAAFVQELEPEFYVADGVVGYRMNGEEPGLAIRTEKINRAVSPVAANPAVRKRIVGWLRAMRSYGDLVMEGRDIGTVVFPEAVWKFYLDASPEERARRRHREMTQQQAGVSVDDVSASLVRRDRIDSGRKADPLRIADGAEAIDSTAMGIEDVVCHIVARVKQGVHAENGGSNGDR